MNSQTKKNPIFISQLELHDKADLQKIKFALDNGKLLFVDTKPIFGKYKQDVMVLKQTLENLRQVVIRRGGSMGRIGDSILVLSPTKNIKIY